MTSEDLVGSHEIQFEAYLADIDPEAQFTWPLDFFQTVIIEAPAPIESLDPVTEEEIISSLIREAPIARTEIKDSYEVVLGDITIFSFDFADPLAIDEEESSLEAAHPVTIDGLSITVTFNQLPSLIQIEEPNYSDGVGFGTLNMIVDTSDVDTGLLQPNSTQAFSGIVTVTVKDLSPEGRTSTFIINIAIVYPALEEPTEDS